MIKIPYLSTRIETDLVMTLALAPLWWVTGFSAFIYPLAAFIVFFKIWTRPEGTLQISGPIFWFFIFSFFYLASILINIGLRPLQRIFASFNNLSLIVMGLFLMIGVYNSDPAIFFKKLLSGCRVLCIITSTLGVVFLILWGTGVMRHVEFPSFLATRFPVFLNYPYFYNFLMISNTMFYPFAGTEEPRLTIYSMVPTATGGIMLVLIPMMMAFYKLQKRRWAWEYPVLFLMAVTVLIFSLSRSAIIGFIFAFILVFIVEKGIKTWLAFLYALGAFTFSGTLFRGIEWILNARKSSTVGRFELYEQAVQILLEENSLMGIGVRLRDDFTMMAIGSHSLYIEILFVAGFIGLPLFLLYQFLVIKKWFSQKRSLENQTEKILWRYLGMSLIALNVWVITDTLLGLPFTAYGYYLIVGGILLLGKSLGRLPEPLFQ